MKKLEAQNISLTTRIPVLTNFSYSFEKGIYGILTDQPGENSNLLKVLAGLLEPAAGSVTLEGKNVFTSFDKSERVVRKEIGFVFQLGGLLANLSIMENLLLPFDFHFPEIPLEEKKERINLMLHSFALKEEILNHRPASLTVSVRKALLFVRMLLVEPTIIFYDNPFMNCTLQLKNILMELILTQREKNCLQIFSDCTDTKLLGIAGRILVFKSGVLYMTGTLDELKATGDDFIHDLISNLYDE